MMKRPILFLLLFVSQRYGLAQTYRQGIPDIIHFNYPYYFAYPVNLSINGQSYSDKIPIQFRDNQIYVSSLLLKALNPTNPLANLAKQDFFSLAKINHIQYGYQPATHTLQLSVPSRWLKKQWINVAAPLSSGNTIENSGVLFTYHHYYATNFDDNPLFSSQLDANFFNHYGSFSTGIQLTNNRYANRSRLALYRLDSYWTYNDFQRDITYILGDTTTQNNAIADQVNFAGLSITKNYNLDPQMITYPLPTVQGSAKVPSTVDLFINGQHLANQQINPGPFSLSNIPFIDGSGKATLLITDRAGRLVSSTISLYSSNLLLKQGLAKYHFSTGLLHYLSSRHRDNYKTPFINYSYSYGLNNQLTLLTHGQTAQDLAVLGIGSNILLAASGVLTTDLLYSHYHQYNSVKYGISYQYNAQHYHFLVGYHQYQAHFTDLANYQYQAAAEQSDSQLSYSSNLSANYAIGASYFYIHQFDGSHHTVANLSLSQNHFFSGSLLLSIGEDFEQHDISGMVSVSLPFGNNWQTNFSTAIDKETINNQLEISKIAPAYQGIGWHASYSVNNQNQVGYKDLAFTWNNALTNMQVGGYGYRHLNYWATVAGSFAYMDAHFFAANQLGNTFAIIDTDGIANVPYYYNGALYGKTDQHGIGFINQVTPYVNSQFSIDATGLPYNVAVNHTEQHGVFKDHSAGIIDFKLRQIMPKALHVVDSHHHSLPVGSLVRFEQHSNASFIGYNGTLLLEDDTQPQTIRVILSAQQQCTIHYRGQAAQQEEYRCEE